jgi:hypothetical protein
MDFDQAILAHTRWKSRLKNHIEGQEQVDPAILAKDDQCDLGKWLHGEATEYSGLRAFADLKAKHAKFHTVAAAVAQSARSCSPETALESLQPLSEYGRASSDCVMALAALKQSAAAKYKDG